MTDLQRTRWGDRAVQQRLQEIMTAHSQRLHNAGTPQSDKYALEFDRRAIAMLESDIIDGKELYRLLNDTGGFDYAVDLYRTYRDWIADQVGVPELRDIADELDHMPELDPEIITGILRRGHQMLIAGGSKTSKSFLALELAVSVALGRDWIDKYPCKQGRVLYVNGEIAQASCDRRIDAILNRLKIARETLRGKMSIVTLRGIDVSASALTERVVRVGEGNGYDLIILDPIYTLGDVTDENNAAEVRRFLREIGSLATETGAAVVCIHHHSKGQQGGKRSIDRASGSGVFGRWFDAIIDLSTVRVPEGVAEQSKTPDSVAMRLEFDLRDFKQPDPLSIWWHYPVHIPDVSGELDGLLIDGDPRGNLKQYQKGTGEQHQAQVDGDMVRAIEALEADGLRPTVAAVAKELSVSDRTIRDWLKNSKSVLKDGAILKTEDRK